MENLERKYQFFISSTYMDLKEERQAVMDAVIASGHFPVGMEYFPAGNEDQFEYIKKLIDQVDYYLLILAGKYGSICPRTGKSYTEMEYDYAVSQNIPIAVLPIKNIDELTGNKIEKGSSYVKLKKFRKKCLESRVVTFWDNVGELQYKTSRAVDNLIKTMPRTGWVKGGLSIVNKYEKNGKSESVTMEDVFCYAKEIANELLNSPSVSSRFLPDLILGIGRGGAIFSSLLSYNLAQVKIMVIDRNHEWNNGVRVSRPFYDFSLPDKSKYNKILIVIGEDHSGTTLENFKEYVSRHNPAATIKTCSLCIQSGIASYPDYYGIMKADFPLMPWQDKDYIRDSHSPQESDLLKKAQNENEEQIEKQSVNEKVDGFSILDYLPEDREELDFLAPGVYSG